MTSQTTQNLQPSDARRSPCRSRPGPSLHSSDAVDAASGAAGVGPAHHRDAVRPCHGAL